MWNPEKLLGLSDLKYKFILKPLWKYSAQFSRTIFVHFVVLLYLVAKDQRCLICKLNPLEQEDCNIEDIDHVSDIIKLKY